MRANERYLRELDDTIEKCDPRYCMQLRAMRGLDSIDVFLGVLFSGFTTDGDAFRISDVAANRINRHLQNLLQEINDDAVKKFKPVDKSYNMANIE